MRGSRSFEDFVAMYVMGVLCVLLVGFLAVGLWRPQTRLATLLTLGFLAGLAFLAFAGAGTHVLVARRVAARRTCRREREAASVEVRAEVDRIAAEVNRLRDELRSLHDSYLADVVRMGAYFDRAHVQLLLRFAVLEGDEAAVNRLRACLADLADDGQVSYGVEPNSSGLLMGVV